MKDEFLKKQQKGNAMKAETTHSKSTTSKSNNDAALEKEIKNAVTKSLDTKVHNLAIKVKKGEVTLQGHVDDESDITRVTAIVERVKGVTQVENKMISGSQEKASAAAVGASSAKEKKTEKMHDTKEGSTCG